MTQDLALLTSSILLTFGAVCYLAIFPVISNNYLDRFEKVFYVSTCILGLGLIIAGFALGVTAIIRGPGM